MANPGGPLVELSLSGTSFTLLRSTVENTDWILSKAAQEETPGGVPWGVYENGRYFIDGDADSFRWVIHFIKYGSLPSGMEKTSVEAIRCLADFLCFQSLVAHIDKTVVPLVSEREQKDQETIQELQKQCADLKDKLADFERISEVLEEMEIRCYRCTARRLRRRHNVCNDRVILLFDEDHDISLDFEESKCLEATSDSWGGFDRVKTNKRDSVLDQLDSFLQSNIY